MPIGVHLTVASGQAAALHANSVLAGIVLSGPSFLESRYCIKKESARDVANDYLQVSTPAEGRVTTPTSPALLKENDVLIFDPEILARLRAYQIAGEEDMVAGVLKRFLSGAETQVQAMRAAMEGDDVAAAGAAGHGMKASAAFAGAMRLSAACAQLDNAARGASLPQAREAFDGLQREYDAVLPFLRAALQEALRRSPASAAIPLAVPGAATSPITQSNT